MQNLTWILFAICVLAIMHVNAASNMMGPEPNPIQTNRPKFTRAGCFVDARGRDLKAKRFSSVTMTRERCNKFCAKNKFKYGAVQQG